MKTPWDNERRCDLPECFRECTGCDCATLPMGYSTEYSPEFEQWLDSQEDANNGAIS